MRVPRSRNFSDWCCTKRILSDSTGVEVGNPSTTHTYSRNVSPTSWWTCRLTRTKCAFVTKSPKRFQFPLLGRCFFFRLLMVSGRRSPIESLRQPGQLPASCVEFTHWFANRRCLFSSFSHLRKIREEASHPCTSVGISALRMPCVRLWPAAAHYFAGPERKDAVCPVHAADQHSWIWPQASKLRGGHRLGTIPGFFVAKPWEYTPTTSTRFSRWLAMQNQWPASTNMMVWWVSVGPSWF